MSVLMSVFQCSDGLLTFFKSKNVTLLTFQCQCSNVSALTACLPFLKVKMLPCLPSNVSVPVFRRLAYLFLKVKMLPCLPSNVSALTACLPFLKVKMLPCLPSNVSVPVRLRIAYLF